ncbi:MAG: flagellum-specific muramidase [Pseudomonadota bacterium]
MTAMPGLGGGLDARALGNLRAQAGSDPRAAIQQAAKQFEALFMQELMKSMRSATLSSGMLENSGTEMGTELLDSQFANKLTGLPGGLSALMAKQLERQLTGSLTAAPRADAAPGEAPAWTRASGASGAQAFVVRHSDAAAAAQAETGIPATFILSQAAHESGWGRREIRHADGTPSNNLFGIKAGAGWKGPVAEVMTTEFVDGQPRKVMAKFRAYASHEESFRDYARMIKNSPRYAGVLEEGGSAQGFAANLQRAGYATDPEYATKLGRVINTTLRLQRTLNT